MIGHLLLSLVLSGAAVAVLVRGLRFRPGKPVWSLFLLLFFAIWAGGLWLAPVGPSHFGIIWLPFLLIAVLLSVLVVAVSPHERQSHRQEVELEREVVVGVGLFFWVLIGALIAAIVAAYR